MMFNGTFNNDHLYRVIGGGNRSTQRKPLTLYHIMLYRVRLAYALEKQTTTINAIRHIDQQLEYKSEIS